MKKLISVVAILSLTGCAYLQSTNAKIAAWWAQPATQTGIKVLEQEALTFAEQVGLNALSQWADTGKVNTKTMLVQAGANTLSSTAAQLRALQGTAQVADPNAIAAALESNGYTTKTAQVVAGQLAQNIQALANQTGNADAANETTASGLDKAVAAVTQQ